MRPSVPQSTDSELTIHKTVKSVSDLIADCPSEQVFDAHRILDENPELKGDHSVILDLAYEEYCRRTENGEEIDLTEFVTRFPDVKTPLLDLIDVHQVLYDNPSVLTGGVSPRWPDVGESHLDLKLIEKIGSGSFSQVYVASESGVGERRVVAKLCTNARHEASLLGRLEHPHIVPVLSVKNDRQKNVSAICMPYMSRTTLAHAIEFLHQRGRQATTRDLVEMLFEREHETVPVPAEVSGFCRKSQLQDVMIEIAIQLCRGLEFAHSRGVIHGDLKPSNILLTKQGTALLMDFNLSQQLRPESSALGGTLAYMAPEQLAILSRNQRQPQSVSCNEQTDVYSFGVLLAELFTGSHPFCTPDPQDSPAESARKLFEQQQEKPIAASDLAPQIGMPLAKIIETCLALDPRKRWDNVQALRAALEQTTTLTSRTLRLLRRERKRAIGIGVVLCFSLMAAGLVYSSLPSESQQRVFDGVIAMEEERWEDAIDAFNRAIDLETQQLETPTAETQSLLAEAHMGLGNRFVNEARYPQAIDELKEARRLDPSSEAVREAALNAYLLAGLAAQTEQRTSQAVALFSEARELAPDAPEVLWRLSRAYLADRKVKDAIQVAKHWRDIQPQDARAVANLGICYYMQGELEVGKPAYLWALEEFEKALDLEGNVSKAAILSNIGLCQCKTQKLLKAVESSHDAIQISATLRSPEERVVPYLLYMKSKFQIAFTNKRERDPEWIGEFLRQAPASAELLIEAARCYALASKVDSQVTRELHEAYLKASIDCTQRACRIGATKDDLEKIQRLQPELKGHQEWQRLVESAADATGPRPERSLLEPLL